MLDVPETEAKHVLAEVMLRQAEGAMEVATEEDGEDASSLMGETMSPQRRRTPALATPASRPCLPARERGLILSRRDVIVARLIAATQHFRGERFGHLGVGHGAAEQVAHHPPAPAAPDAGFQLRA